MHRRFVRFAVLLLGGVIVMGHQLMTHPTSPVFAAMAADQQNVELVIDVAGEASGQVTIELFADVAPLHVARITELVREGAYDSIVFHRVIDGFMAQTGDVQFGRADGNTRSAGRGGSDKPNLKAEFSDIPFDRGVIGMARGQSANTANSQFFIMLAPAPHLNGAYTVVGQVIDGMDVVDAIKLGKGRNGAIIGAPDKMTSVTIVEPTQ